MPNLYEAASKNHREVEKALTQLERAIKRCIRDNDSAAVTSLTPAQLLLVSIKAESRMIKILHQPGGFTAGEREQVLAEDQAIERWRSMIEVAFRKHFKIKPRNRLEDGLDHDSLAKRATLHGLIDDELKLVISLRNKLAHGQWVYPFNSAWTAVEGAALSDLKSETCLSIQHRDNLVTQLGNAVTQLVDSTTAFEKSFDGYFDRIRDNRRHLAEDNYEDWCASIRRTKVNLARGP